MSWNHIKTEHSEFDALKALMAEESWEYVAYHGLCSEEILRLLAGIPEVDSVWIHTENHEPWLVITGWDDKYEALIYEERYPDWFNSKIEFCRPSYCWEGFHEFGDLYVVDSSNLYVNSCEASRIERMLPRYTLIAGEAVLTRKPNGYEWIEGKSWLIGKRIGPESSKAASYRRMHHERRLNQAMKRAQNPAFLD